MPHCVISLILSLALTIWAGDTICFQDGMVLGAHGFVERDLWVSDGKIVEPQAIADREIDMKGHFLAPGFIDVQCNGAFGVDFTREPERIDEVACQLPLFGVTAFLPTLVSSKRETYERAMPILRQHLVKGGAEILGIHLEGPFINPEKNGCHVSDYLALPDSIANLTERYGTLDSVKMLTLAPELAGALAVISELKARGIVISGGHSMATVEEAKDAMMAGMTMSTHLFNAMNFAARSPGLPGFALTTDQMSYGCIADGIHIHSVAVNLAWRSHPKGLVLVTDAMAALGLPDGTYRLGDVEVDVGDGAAYVSGTKTLAGSVCPMEQMVRNLVKFTGCSPEEALRAASKKPAELLGLFPQKGSLDVGADADFVVLDTSLFIIDTYVAGASFRPFS